MSEEMTWRSIDSAPTDETEFVAGYWHGEAALDEEYNQVAWIGEPVWVQAITHNEGSLEGRGRGWNHRNGPFDRYPTYWHPLASPLPSKGFPVLPPPPSEVAP